jgi:TolA-binding protein
MSAAAMVLLFAVVFFSLHRGDPGAKTEDMALRPSSEDASDSFVLLPGQRTTVKSPTLLATKDKALKIGLSPGSTLEVSALGRDGVAVVLRSGLAAIDLDHDKRIPFVISVNETQIRITGTVLFVDATLGKTGVLEGSIEVLTAGKPTVLLQAGQELELSTSTLTPLRESTTRYIQELLGQAPTAAIESPLETAVKAALDSAPAISTAERPGDASEKTSPRTVPSPRNVQETASQNERPTDLEAQQTPALDKNLLAEARRCRAAKDWVCAAENYSLAISKLPGSNEALVATVALAELELEQLDKPEAALAHYNDYLRTAPRGVLASEAMYGRCRTLSTLGRLSDEKSSLKTLVETFPDSPYARSARSRLEYLTNQ